MPAIRPTRSLYRYAVRHHVRVFFITGRRTSIRSTTIVFLQMTRRPPRFPLFPYTTLFRFTRDLAERRHAARVDRDVESADVSAVGGTPTFFINGRRHQGAYDIDTLSASVTAAGARAAMDRGTEPTVLDTAGPDRDLRSAANPIMRRARWHGASAWRGAGTIWAAQGSLGAADSTDRDG